MTAWWRELLVVIPDFKVAYFAIPKAGNTTIKLALAQLMGLDESHFEQSDWPHSSAALGVHNQQLAPWPKPSEIPAALKAITNELDDWFVFTVVRDPLWRLVSAWELLILLEDPHLKVMGRWTADMTVATRREPFAIAKAFQEFASSSQLKFLADEDAHFIPQTKLLAGAPFAPDVFRLERLEVLEQALDVHFSALGMQGPRISCVNESLVPRSLFDIGGLNTSLVHSIYAGDYTQLGYTPDYSSAASNDADENEALATRAVLRVCDGNRRIYSLWTSGRGST